MCLSLWTIPKDMIWVEFFEIVKRTSLLHQNLYNFRKSLQRILEPRVLVQIRQFFLFLATFY
jgi:hypothetical protein